MKSLVSGVTFLCFEAEKEGVCTIELAYRDYGRLVKDPVGVKCGTSARKSGEYKKYPEAFTVEVKSANKAAK